MLSDNSFTKDNLDKYLKELAKEYRNAMGKTYLLRSSLLAVHL